jgi:hypothetical protein
MVTFDEFVKGIHDGDHLQDVELELLERRNGRVVPVKYTGGYVIVDNGYLRWSATVPPFKVTDRMNELRWSKWVESMRKNVECAFGILKGRWRILKTGVRVQGVEAVDKVWLTCCALHNWLLEIDGLDDDWEGRDLPSTSVWEGELGDVDVKGLSNNIVELATANSLPVRSFDSSGMGPGEDINAVEERHPLDIDLEVHDNDIGDEDNEVRRVADLGLGYFRSRLVEHFDILFKQNKVK